jgi:hypothetical protein
MESSSATTVPSHSSGLPIPPVLDYTATLRALNKQYLQAYIDVLSALTSGNPPASVGVSVSVNESGSSALVESALKRVNDISANLSWLLTQLRSHQATQTVIQMQLRQIERRKAKTKEVHRLVEYS